SALHSQLPARPSRHGAGCGGGAAKWIHESPDPDAMKLRIPRRILMTADPIGGVWTFALELTRAFEPYGVEVVLATMGARLTPAQHQEVAGRKNLRVFESNYRLEWMDDAWDDVDRASDWLLTLAKRVQPDLIHLNGYSHALLPWRVPAVVTAHSCVLSWWRAVKKEEAPAQYTNTVAASGRGWQRRR